jgi:hypothetical protein
MGLFYVRGEIRGKEMMKSEIVEYDTCADAGGSRVGIAKKRDHTIVQRSLG